MENIVNIFKALSDKTRIKILWTLCKTRIKLCVCEIMDSLNESHYKISRHLKILKNVGIVKEDKKGKWVFYSLEKPENDVQKFIFKAICSLPKELLHEEDRRLTRRLALRKKGKCVEGIKSKKWKKILKRIKINLVKRTK